ncbi:hypothetical protein AOLI_G00063030 [Acnodon oligacanthus]
MGGWGGQLEKSALNRNKGKGRLVHLIIRSPEPSDRTRGLVTSPPTAACSALKHKATVQQKKLTPRYNNEIRNL